MRWNVLQRHKLWMIVEHHRCLDHGGMLERNTGKPVRENHIERFAAAELPMLHAHHFHPVVGTDVTHRGLDTFGHVPLVLEMPDDGHEAPDTMPMKFPHRVADHCAQRRPVETRRAAKMLAAAAS